MPHLKASTCNDTVGGCCTGRSPGIHRVSSNATAASTGTGEEILYADVDPAKSRRKHFIRVPGKHEIDRFADRRPEMYGKLTEG